MVAHISFSKQKIVQNSNTPQNEHKCRHLRVTLCYHINSIQGKLSSLAVAWWEMADAYMHVRGVETSRAIAKLKGTKHTCRDEY